VANSFLVEHWMVDGVVLIFVLLTCFKLLICVL
jgi:hypothetical protein